MEQSDTSIHPPVIAAPSTREAGSDSIEASYRRAAANTAITLIFNQHGSPQDAEASTAYVEPDSVVFVESATKEGYVGAFEQELRQLSDIRLEQGKASTTYQSQKEQLLRKAETAYAQVTGGVAAQNIDFVRLRNLLQKDCLVYAADYRYLDEQALGENAANMNRLVRELDQGLPLEDVLDNKFNSADTLLDHMAVRIDCWSRGHEIRDATACRRTLRELNLVLDAEQLDDLRLINGKLQAYVLYGSAHARSLKWQFNQYGADAISVEVEHMSDYEYLDTAEERGRNFCRRLGHTLFQGLAIRYAGQRATIDIERAYGSLAYLNAIDDDADRIEKCRAFCQTVGNILLKSPEDPSAYQDYRSLANSLAVPEPDSQS